MLGQMVNARRGALLILQNAFLYPKEGKMMVKELSRMANSQDLNGTIRVMKNICSAFPNETKEIFSIATDKLEYC